MWINSSIFNELLMLFVFLQLKTQWLTLSVIDISSDFFFRKKESHIVPLLDDLIFLVMKIICVNRNAFYHVLRRRKKMWRSSNCVCFNLIAFMFPVQDDTTDRVLLESYWISWVCSWKKSWKTKGDPSFASLLSLHFLMSFYDLIICRWDFLQRHKNTRISWVKYCPDFMTLIAFFKILKMTSSIDKCIIVDVISVIFLQYRRK